MVELAVPAAGRTLGLLELMLASPEGVTPQECVDRLEISRSTLFELLQTLKVLGYIEQSAPRARYRAGPRLLAWRGSSLGDPQELLNAFFQEAAAPPLDETLALLVSSPPQFLLLAQRVSSQRVRIAFESGQRFAADETAANLILTSSPSATVRSMGFHIKVNADSFELALPICRDGHSPSAALLLSAPRYRHTLDGLMQHVDPMRQMAARLSYRLGAPVYAPYKTALLPKIEPSTPLAEDEINTFLQGPWVASLACIRPSGTPHVIPIWHEWDGDSFFVAAWSGSRWSDYLLQNPHVSLTIDEPWPPLRRISAHGKALPLSEEDLVDGIPALLERLSLRFLGQPLSPELASRPWRAFRITPEQMQGVRGLQAEGA